MPEIIITGCWIILFLFFIRRSHFFQIDGISKNLFYPAFLFKIALGFANYYIWLNVIHHGDSLRYVHDSNLVYETLWHHPVDYFQLLIGHSKDHVPEHLKYVTQNLNFEWHVSEYNMVRLFAILNVFSFGSPWGNIVILSFISFITSVALFRALLKNYYQGGQGQRILFMILFFIPSVIFWSSGLLKEGPTLLLMNILFVQLMHLEKQFSWRSLIIVIIVFFLTWLVRDYLLFLLLPNLLIFFALHFLNRTRFKYYLIGTFICILPVLIISLFNNFPASHLKNEQAYFLMNPPDPDYQFRVLDGTTGNIVLNIPYTVNNILFRPNFLKSDSAFRLYQSAELLLTWLFVIFCILRFRKPSGGSVAQLFFLFFALEILLVYGLLVTDADTLSRYRTIPLYFLVILIFINSKPLFNLKK